MKFLDEMYKAAQESAPREMCGLVVRQNDTEKWILCENISEDKDDFEIDPKVFVQYQLTSKILYVVHSHYDQKNLKASIFFAEFLSTDEFSSIKIGSLFK